MRSVDAKTARTRLARVLVFPVAWLLSASPASAQPAGFVLRPAGTVDWSLRVGAGHSDNILREAIDPQPDRFEFIGTNFDYVRDGNRVDIDIVGDLEFRDYGDPVLESEPVGFANAGLSFSLVPQRFDWRVNDNYGTGRTNPFIAMGPQNRQSINVFSTGPTADLPLGGRTALQLAATRTETRFETTNRVDSDSDDYDITLLRTLSPTSELGIGGSRRDLTFKGTTDGIERESVFVQYRRELASGGASLQFGETEVVTAQGKFDSLLVDVNWARDVGTRSRLGLRAGHGFSDAAVALVQGNAGANPGVGNNLVIAVRDPYEFTQVSANYSAVYDRSGFGAYVGVGEAQYTNTAAFNNDEKFYGFNFQRDLTSRLSLYFVVTFVDREFQGATQADSDEYGEIRIRKEFGRRWAFQSAYEYYSRDRNNLSDSYDERVLRLSIFIDMNP